MLCKIASNGSCALLAPPFSRAAAVRLRTQLENLIASKCFGNDKDGERLPTPPFVLLVIGGGPGTYRTVLETLKLKRPVVCVADSGGAAQTIQKYVSSGGSLDGIPPSGNNALLPEIKHYGEMEVGANQDKQLSFFTTQADATSRDDFAKARSPCAPLAHAPPFQPLPEKAVFRRDRRHLGATSAGSRRSPCSCCCWALVARAPPCFPPCAACASACTQAAGSPRVTWLSVHTASRR